MENVSKHRNTTFVPVKPTFPFFFLALDAGGGNGSPDMKLLERNCQGQQWRNVVLFFEDGDKVGEAEKELKELKKSEMGKFPALVQLASDA
jgi:hypothetical protein